MKINHKFRSVKLWIYIVLIIIICTFVITGIIGEDNFANILISITVTFMGANVGSKWRRPKYDFTEYNKN